MNEWPKTHSTSKLGRGRCAIPNDLVVGSVCQIDCAELGNRADLKGRDNTDFSPGENTNHEG